MNYGIHLFVGSLVDFFHFLYSIFFLVVSDAVAVIVVVASLEKLHFLKTVIEHILFLLSPFQKFMGISTHNIRYTF